MPRLDRILVDRGLAASRTLASRLIREGSVLVNGRAVNKPAFEVSGTDGIALRENPLTRYVSRGGLKLEEALTVFGIDPAGLVCADIGASTGGFTDCLLQNGAEKVYAVDSGTNQLHPRLREDGRVVSLENVNARFLDGSLFPPVDLVVMDVSFISQAKLYPALARIIKGTGRLVTLIKPQFEVGKSHIGSGGVVRDEKAKKECIEALRAAAGANGFVMDRVIPSPITGGDGNEEYLALFQIEEKQV
ncbi:MAG: TlyA family RNA methyltransferase [Clostridia bacterium]|nr:TlyA family RNA methyltransferase [Clostridia bacterium]